MIRQLKQISYADLNARQKEAFNFQDVSFVLANLGCTTIRLSSDWQGADFIAQHLDGTTFLKVQLKGRLCFYKKYMGRDLYICFRSGNDWYLYPHDRLLKELAIDKRKFFRERGGLSYSSFPKKFSRILERYRLIAQDARWVHKS